MIRTNTRWVAGPARRRIAGFGLAVLLSASFAGTWMLSSSPTSVPHDWVGLPSAVQAAANPAGAAVPPSMLDAGYRTYPAGCVDRSDSEAVNAAIEKGLGPLIAFDAVHQMPLGGGRTLWLVQDGYLAHTTPVSSLRDAQYASSVAVVFGADGCGTVLVRPETENRRVSFENGDGRVTKDRFFWPLSGELVDGRLVILWAEMTRSPKEPDWMDGITRHPGRTFVASYDPATLKRLSWSLSPEPDPLWGFATVTSTDGFTYLFGNENLLNLAMNGGYGSGPHPATRMYLARIPAGSLGHPFWDLEVWDGNGFVDDGVPAPISERGWAANMMRPTFDESSNRWLSVTVSDEFWGGQLVVETAPAPQGPWTVTDTGRPTSPIGGAVRQVSYHPTMLSIDGCAATVAVSWNAAIWAEAVAYPRAYRPHTYLLDVC